MDGRQREMQIKQERKGGGPTLEYLIIVQIKRSHSIHMLSIQIDTKSIKLVIHHQFNNIKFSLFASHVKRSHCVRLIDAVRLLG